MEAIKRVLENPWERPDFAKNVLVVGIRHFLNPEAKARIEEYVQNADYVCIEWDNIRDNEAKGLPGGYKDYSHLKLLGAPELKGDHLYLNPFDTFLNKQVRGKRKELIEAEAVKNGGSSDFKSPEGNEFLLIQELCKKYGKPCYFVDRPITHTRHRLMELYEKMEISMAHERDSKDRSTYMEGEVKKIAEERFVATGKEEQCALFVGNDHLKDFPDRRFKKAKPPTINNVEEVNFDQD